jgi:hypothetical protein
MEVPFDLINLNQTFTVWKKRAAFRALALAQRGARDAAGRGIASRRTIL